MGRMDFARLNPLNWFSKQRDDYGSLGQPDTPDDYDGEKIKTLVPMPVILPYFDMMQTADENQAMRRAYRQMFRSPIVKAALFQKVFNAATLEFQSHAWKIGDASPDKRDAEIADFVKYQFTDGVDGGIPEMTWNVLMHSLIDGLSVNEEVWDLEDSGQWKNKEMIRFLKPKDVDQDLYLWVDSYRNVTAVQGLHYNSGEMWSPDDFVIHQNCPLFGNPGGMSDLRAAYTPWWGLDTVEKLRAMGAEKRAFPVVSAEYTRTDTQKNIQGMLSQLRYSNWMAVPQGVKLEVHNIAQGASEYFSKFRQDKIEEIFLGIQFAFLHSIGGSSGHYLGSSQVAQHVSSLAVWWLAQQLMKIMNRKGGLVQKVVDRNFRNVRGYPKCSLTMVDLDALNKKADIAVKWWGTGWRFKKSWVEQTFNIPFAHDETDAMPTIMELHQVMPGGQAGSALAAGQGHDAPKNQGRHGSKGAA